MIVNPKILTILEQYKINRDDAICYLIALYNNLNPSYIPDILKRQIYCSGIVNRGEQQGTIQWIVPLFKPEEEKQWDWVLDKYRSEFVALRNDAGGDKKSCMSKMQLYFRENSDVTQEEVMAATYEYLDQFKSGKQSISYLQRADYFILKIQRGGGGVTYESRLTAYIEIVREHRKKAESQIKYVLK